GSAYITQGSSFQAKYTYKGNQSDGGATITNTTPTTDLTTSDTTYTVTGVGDVVITPTGDSCFTDDTIITLADGTHKKISEISKDDRIISYNFFTGEFEEQSIVILVNHGTREYEVLHMIYDDGTELKTIGEHGIFNYDLNQFVYPTKENYLSYIGHKFVKYNEDTNSYELVTLVDAYYDTMITGAWSITSSSNSNAIANNMLTVAPPANFHNWITMGDKLRYDMDAFQQDIETYGLYTYEELKDYMTYEQFVEVGQYLKIPVEKGYFTFEYIIELIEQYKDWFI
ncbi:MAG: Hint domain-containing protein, partial [Anaeroplasma sp.]|uniref:Hint domain-containing protein n=1 Tax=Anaeroplasma sp. TaxID=1872523 RepID=UPI002A910688